MRDLLIQLGVRADDVIVESRATTTFENAVESRMLLASRGLEKRKIVVVTEAIHMTTRPGLLPHRRNGRHRRTLPTPGDWAQTGASRLRALTVGDRSIDGRASRMARPGLVLHPRAYPKLSSD